MFGLDSNQTIQQLSKVQLCLLLPHFSFTVPISSLTDQKDEKAVRLGSQLPSPPRPEPATGIPAARRALHRAERDKQDPSADALSPCEAPSRRCQETHDEDTSVQTRMLPRYFKTHRTTQTLSFEVSVRQMTLLRYHQLILSSWLSGTNMMGHLPPSPSSWGNGQASVFQGLPRWKGCDRCLSATEVTPKTPSLDWAQGVKAFGR